MTNDALPVRQLTWRAAMTGAVLGALLVPCNVYSGLKVGFTVNMSIAAALLGAAYWGPLYRLILRRESGWDKLENTVSQTTASAAASIISAGLVAPIPALTILTGENLSWGILSLWMLVISSLGVFVGLLIRKQMLVIQQLPFPTGVATAETIREIHTVGGEASRRAKYLSLAIAVAASLKLVGDFVYKLPQLGPALPLSKLGLPALTTKKLGFAIEPGFLMFGIGAIVGLRVGLSMLLGAIFGWAVLTPWLYATGRIPEAVISSQVFADAVEFLMWPGVALMISAALVSFALSLPAFARSVLQRKPAPAEHEVPEAATGGTESIKRPIGLKTDRELVGSGFSTQTLLLGFCVVSVAVVFAQVSIFAIHPAMAVLAVVITFALAIVASRVSGETSIPPIGALGKITQLTFGVIHPTDVSTNLMTANVTGGAAGQCSDLLHDLKAGQLIGASIRAQSLAQLLGVLVGSFVGSAAYLVLVPDPANMLLTDEWPAPAVMTWKTVAELFRDGIDSAPQGAFTAAMIAALVGTLLTITESVLPTRWRRICPSASSMGLAFVIPASMSVSLFLGAAVAAVVMRYSRRWGRVALLPIAAGLIAGESLAGVAGSIFSLFSRT